MALENITESLRLKIYKDAIADPGIIPPTQYHSNTIKGLKKVWLYSMLNKMNSMDNVTGTGNSMYCTEINALIASLIVTEALRQDMLSHAHSLMIADEYTLHIAQLGHEDTNTKVWLAAYFCYQVRIIVRVEKWQK